MLTCDADEHTAAESTDDGWQVEDGSSCTRQSDRLHRLFGFVGELSKRNMMVGHHVVPRNSRCWLANLALSSRKGALVDLQAL